MLFTAESNAGFSLVTQVEPAIETSRLDFVKVLVGWSPLDTEIAEDEAANALAGNGGS